VTAQGYSIDEHGRMRPGTVPGWGASWWMHEQRVTREAFASATPERRLRLLFDYFAAVDEGWEPPVPRAQWAGPHHWVDRDACT
jgi:hypothetical protein